MSAVLTPTRQATARRGLAIHLAVVVVLSVPLEIAVIRARTTTSRICSGSPCSCSFRRWPRSSPGWPSARASRTSGSVGVVTSVGTSWPRRCSRSWSGPSSTAWRGRPDWSTSGLLPLGVWAGLVTAMLVLNLVASTGEELGWRGYMLGHMVDAGVPRPILVSSLVWGLWHVPLFLWGGLVPDGPSPLVTTALMMVTTTALGYVLGRLTLDIGNVWPAVALHVVWNTVIQAGFHPAAVGDDRALWVGETGILTVAVLVVVAVAYRRRPRSGRWS